MLIVKGGGMRFKIPNMIFSLLSLFCFFSCSTIGEKKDYKDLGDGYVISSLKETTTGDNLEIKTDIPITPLELTYNLELYQYWINHFTKKSPINFRKHLEMASAVKSVVQKILAKNNVPVEFFYLGLIESGYSFKIQSKSKAAGPWQFMKRTARAYGLTVNKDIDERYNLYKSTEAAARYLSDLYKTFNNWELALCAYNAGPKRIFKGLKEGNVTSYHELAQRGLIPQETINYIPKMIAARSIYLDPEGFSFYYQKQNDSLFREIKKIKISENYSLRELNTDLLINNQELLYQLNPEYNNGIIKIPRGKKQFVFVPEYEQENKNSRAPASNE